MNEPLRIVGLGKSQNMKMGLQGNRLIQGTEKYFEKTINNVLIKLGEEGKHPCGSGEEGKKK